MLRDAKNARRKARRELETPVLCCSYASMFPKTIPPGQLEGNWYLVITSESQQSSYRPTDKPNHLPFPSLCGDSSGLAL